MSLSRNENFIAHAVAAGQTDQSLRSSFVVFVPFVVHFFSHLEANCSVTAKTAVTR